MTEEEKNKVNDLSNIVIGAAIEVHRELGPGLLESVYEECFCIELKNKGLSYQRQITLPVYYKGSLTLQNLKIDVLIEDKIICELKSVETILPVHKAQLLTYLKLTKLWLGLLINFNTKTLKKGLSRVVNG